MTIRTTLMTSVAALAIAGAAYAQSTDAVETEADAMLQNGEAAVSDAADATGDALEAGAQEVAEGAEAAGDAISEETTELAVEADAAVEGAGDAVEAETAGTTTMVPLEDADTDTADAPLEGDAMVEETEAAEVEVTESEAVIVSADADPDGVYGIFGERAVSDLIGMDVLAREGDSAEMEDVGEIESLVNASGDVLAVVGVGGFLGLGEHDVAIPLRDFREGEGGLILPDFTEEELEALAPYEEEYEALPMDVTVAGDPVSPIDGLVTDAPVTDAPVVTE